MRYFSFFLLSIIISVGSSTLSDLSKASDLGNGNWDEVVEFDGLDGADLLDPTDDDRFGGLTATVGNGDLDRGGTKSEVGCRDDLLLAVGLGTLMAVGWVSRWARWALTANVEINESVNGMFFDEGQYGLVN